MIAEDKEWDIITDFDALLGLNQKFRNFVMLTVSLCLWREGSEEAILHIGRSLLDNAHLAAKLFFNLGKALFLAGLDT